MLVFSVEGGGREGRGEWQSAPAGDVNGDGAREIVGGGLARRWRRANVGETKLKLIGIGGAGTVYLKNMTAPIFSP